MFLPEVNEENFSMYYRRSWVYVTHTVGKKQCIDYLSYLGNSNWVNQNGDTQAIARASITNIEVPALGYYVHNEMPMFAARIPARITTKGLSQENSKTHALKDFQVLSGVGNQPWSADKQPLFSDWFTGGVAAACKEIGTGKRSFAVLSPELAVLLNCTDGTKNVISLLYYREFLIGKYNRKGELIAGDEAILRQVGAL